MEQVTIGMPLYNNAKTLRASVDSVLAQSNPNFVLLLSDDGSSDDTWDICQQYAQQDSRVKAIRQPKNLNYLNFKYLVDEASSPYFCWLAGDDCLHPDFLQKCITELEQDARLVACSGKCQFTEHDGNQFIAKGTYTIDAKDKSTRVETYLNGAFDNSRMYGVFRTEVLRKSFPVKAFHAYDWALSALTLCYGGHRELDEILMFRDKTPSIRYTNLVDNDHQSRFLRAFPVFAMSVYLLRQTVFPKGLSVLIALYRMNKRKHREYKYSKRRLALGANAR